MPFCSNVCRFQNEFQLRKSTDFAFWLHDSVKQKMKTQRFFLFYANTGWFYQKKNIRRFELKNTYCGLLCVLHERLQIAYVAFCDRSLWTTSKRMTFQRKILSKVHFLSGQKKKKKRIFTFWIRFSTYGEIANADSFFHPSNKQRRTQQNAFSLRIRWIMRIKRNTFSIRYRMHRLEIR